MRKIGIWKTIQVENNNNSFNENENEFGKKRKRNDDDLTKEEIELKKYEEEKRKIFHENYKSFQNLQQYPLEKWKNEYNVGILKVSEWVNYPASELPIPELRNVDYIPVDPKKEDFEFQAMDFVLATNEQFEDRYKTICHVTGVTKDGLNVVLFLEGYKPYFYLSIPKEYYSNPQFFIQKLQDIFKSVDIHYMVQKMTIVEKVPSCGFRPKNNLMKLIKFEFSNQSTQNIVKQEILKHFPYTSKEDIISGLWKVRNETILCETVEEDIKCLNTYHIPSAGWIRLKKATYDFADDNTYRSFYGFRSKTVEGLMNRDDMANMNIDSFDCEQERADGKDIMPEANDPNDHILSISHNIVDLKRKKTPYIATFIWGNKNVLIVENDVKELGINVPTTCYIFRYKDEITMLKNWSLWWSQPQVSSDIIIGYNIFQYDLNLLATRFLEVYNQKENETNESLFMTDEEKCWGRLPTKQVYKKDASIESSAIAFQKYVLTPCFGKVFIDEQILFQRDVMFKSRGGYSLNNVAEIVLKKKKIQLHHSEIRPHFYGTPEQRGRLVIYNMGDVIRVTELCIKSNHIPTVIQACRVNHIPLNMICTRGQSIRVYGGFHYNTMIHNGVIYRPYYHNILDNVVFDDIEKMIKQVEHQDKMDDYKLIRYALDTQSFEFFDLSNQLETISKEQGGFKIHHFKTHETNIPDFPSEASRTNSTERRKIKIRTQLEIEKERENRNIFSFKIDPKNLSSSPYNKLLGIENQEDINFIFDNKNPNITPFGFPKHKRLDKKSKTDRLKDEEKK